ncbi:hypothetical protein HOH51_01420 [bacterium]|nr:hypothetical protein [bacterium]
MKPKQVEPKNIPTLFQVPTFALNDFESEQLAGVSDLFGVTLTAKLSQDQERKLIFEFNPTSATNMVVLPECVIGLQTQLTEKLEQCSSYNIFAKVNLVNQFNSYFGETRRISVPSPDFLNVGYDKFRDLVTNLLPGVDIENKYMELLNLSCKFRNANVQETVRFNHLKEFQNVLTELLEFSTSVQVEDIVFVLSLIKNSHVLCIPQNWIDADVILDFNKVLQDTTILDLINAGNLNFKQVLEQSLLSDKDLTKWIEHGCTNELPLEFVQEILLQKPSLFLPGNGQFKILDFLKRQNAHIPVASVLKILSLPNSLSEANVLAFNEYKYGQLSALLPYIEFEGDNKSENYKIILKSLTGLTDGVAVSGSVRYVPPTNLCCADFGDLMFTGYHQPRKGSGAQSVVRDNVLIYKIQTLFTDKQTSEEMKKFLFDFVTKSGVELHAMPLQGQSTQTFHVMDLNSFETDFAEMSDDFAFSYLLDKLNKSVEVPEDFFEKRPKDRLLQAYRRLITTEPKNSLQTFGYKFLAVETTVGPRKQVSIQLVDNERNVIPAKYYDKNIKYLLQSFVAIDNKKECVDFLNLNSKHLSLKGFNVLNQLGHGLVNLYNKFNYRFLPSVIKYQHKLRWAYALSMITYAGTAYGMHELFEHFGEDLNFAPEPVAGGGHGGSEGFELEGGASIKEDVSIDSRVIPGARPADSSNGGSDLTGAGNSGEEDSSNPMQTFGAAALDAGLDAKVPAGDAGVAGDALVFNLLDEGFDAEVLDGGTGPLEDTASDINEQTEQVAPEKEADRQVAASEQETDNDFTALKQQIEGAQKQHNADIATVDILHEHNNDYHSGTYNPNSPADLQELQADLEEQPTDGTEVNVRTAGGRLLLRDDNGDVIKTTGFFKKTIGLSEGQTATATGESKLVEVINPVTNRTEITIANEVSYTLKGKKYIGWLNGAYTH